jgi:CO/xanthine dehydrogenase FAD-binding subunit
MDLFNLRHYLKPRTLADVPAWQPGMAWLAGGTWLFSEPQPQIETVIDLQSFEWPALEISETGLSLGATCSLQTLKNTDFPPHWQAMQGFWQATQALASFKVQTTATVVGNLCLALPASPFAPLMVALAAEYQILTRQGETTTIAAQDFQIGARQTRLQPGDLLRSVELTAEMLCWRVSFQRMCVAQVGIAIAIVTTAQHPISQTTRIAIGGSLPRPYLLTFPHPPTATEIETALTAQISPDTYLDDFQASAAYRQHITRILIARTLTAIHTP